MPIFLIILGIALLDVAVRNTYTAFFNTTKDLIFGGTSNNNIPFWKWGAAIFIVAALGYYQKARPIAIALIVLVFLVMFVSDNSKALTAVQNLTSKVFTS